MNILTLVFSPAWGGLEMFVGVLAKRFRDKGNNIIGLFSPNPSLEESFGSNQIRYEIIKPTFRYIDFVTASRIKKALSKTRIDIIQVYQSKDLSTAIILKKLLVTPKLIFTQHMDSRYDKKDLFHKWVYKNIDKVICITNDMKKNHIEHTPINENQIEVVHNGIDLNKFRRNLDLDKKRFLEEKSLPKDRLIIGTVARLDRLKNQKLLIEVADNLIQDYKDKIHFILVGDETNSVSGKNYKNELISFIKEKKLDDYFSIFGFSKEIEKFYSILDIFVLTTIKESFGLVLLEAMAMGLPVIASNRGGPPEIIEHEVNGFLFDPDNQKELVTQLYKLISDEKLRKSMGEKSVELVKNKFNLDKKVDKYLQIFQDIL